MIGREKQNRDKIYLIDYGLSMVYWRVKDNQHIPYKEGKSFVGTTRFASRNIHKGYQSSRRDDLESLAYMLIYFLKGRLPWQLKEGQTFVEK